MEIRSDPYATLGISPRASLPGIRHAFLMRARRYRPRQAGERSEERYGDIIEAYHEAYRALREPKAPSAPPVIALEGREAPAPAARPRRLGTGPLSLFRDFLAPSSALAETFERLLRNFTGRRVPKAEALRPLDLEIVLSREDARSGGVLTIEVPTFQRCPACWGTGRDTCFACGGQGLVEDAAPVRLLVPPGVASGTTFMLPLRGLGIGNLALRVHVRADA